MADLAVNDYSRRRDDAIARDRGIIGDLLNADADAESIGFGLHHSGGYRAAFATGAKYFYVFS
jgi:hypothetical protein